MDSFEDEPAGTASAGLGAFESLRDPLGILRRRWRLMLLAFAAGLVATGVAVWMLKPAYEARATVLVASQKLSAEFVRPTIQEDPIERINALTSEVLSRQSLIELVEQHGLHSALIEDEGMNAAVALLRRQVRIDLDHSPGESARVLVISVTDGNAELAATIANDVARRFTVAGIRLRADQARLTADFMRREMEEAERTLREQSKKVSEFQQAHRGELPSELESSLRRLERLQQQRNSLALQIAEAETRLAALRASEQGVVVDSPRSRLVELKAQLARELAVNTEAHPNVASLRRQVALLEKELGGLPSPGAAGGAGRRAVSDAAQRELMQLREQLAATDRELVDLDAKVAQIPARQQELEALTQRETVLRENYLEFSRKLKDAELAQSLELAQQGDRVSVLDPAQPPVDPKIPRWMIALAGLVVSAGLALFLGLFLEWRDPLIVTAETLELAAGVPVLGSLPRIATRS